MDVKWVSVAAAAIFVSMFASIGISEKARYDQRANCVAAYVATDRSAEEINQICK